MLVELKGFHLHIVKIDSYYQDYNSFYREVTTGQRIRRYIIRLVLRLVAQIIESRMAESSLCFLFDSIRIIVHGAWLHENMRFEFYNHYPQKFFFW
jgi:hypothetical protein